MTLVPQLKEELEALGRSDIAIVVGGVIPPDDFEALQDAGVAARHRTQDKGHRAEDTGHKTAKMQFAYPKAPRSGAFAYVFCILL